MPLLADATSLGASQDSRADDGGHDKPVKGPAESEIVTARVDYHGEVYKYKMRAHAKVKKLMKDFCQKAFLDRKAVRFYLDGQRLRGDERMAELDLADDIEVFKEQDGGRG